MAKLDIVSFFDSFDPSDLAAAVNAATVRYSFDSEHRTVSDTLSFVYGVELGNVVDVDGEFIENMLGDLDSANDVEILAEDEDGDGYLSANLYGKFFVVFYVDADTCPAVLVFSTNSIEG